VRARHDAFHQVAQNGAGAIMAQAAAKTGAAPTAIIAIEQQFPQDQRIIVDDLACAILPFVARGMVRLTRSVFVRDLFVKLLERISPGIWALMTCRKRYIDDKLIGALGSIEAVVNLGAGFDTRAYRLPALANVPIWEIDQPENIELKRTRLQELFGLIPAHVTLVSIDFDRQDLSAALIAQDYATSQRTFFIWEGVTQYLTEAGVVATLEFLSKAARGSRLAFTYVRKDFLDGKAMYGQKEPYRRFAAKGIWLFGMEPDAVEVFLNPYGWRVIEHVGYEELAERYVRPTGRTLASTPIERAVYAEKQ
jgi:methyltransferase (TIGR00027 family)